ncbi:MAG: hypothetical protein GY950_14325 [bacterium]|nr:hypothetical protein [bacterium]
MKRKTFNKKLVLKKTTVANLDGDRMNKIKGGTIICTVVKTCICTTQGGQICQNTCGCTTQVQPCQDTCGCTTQVQPCQDTCGS